MRRRHTSTRYTTRRGPSETLGYVVLSRSMQGIGPLVALGVGLARRGVLATIAIGVCAFTVLVLALLAFALAGRGPYAPVHDVPLLASSWLAWGGGFLLAFSAAAHALRRDRAEGVRDLVALRTTTLDRYVF